MKKLALVMSLGLAVAACGDDGGTPSIDAGPDAVDIDAPAAGVCGTPAATISTFPGMFTGATIGNGRHSVVAEGACAVEPGYYGADGEDQVVALTGLTAGATYLVNLTTDEDLSFYVATSCDASGPASGACLLHVDQYLRNESGVFTAPASGSVYIIVDSPDDPEPPATGVYTLAVSLSECEDDTECTAAGENICIANTCVECRDSFDCNAGAPACDSVTNTCVTDLSMCTGDDAGEPDDGSLAARTLTYPTEMSQTVTMAAICSLPAAERDFYKIVAPAAGSIRVAATWTVTGADLDLTVRDSTGAVVASGGSAVATSETTIAALPAAGTYYIEVSQYAPSATAAATPYTLTLSVPECATNFDCELAGAPVCTAGTCVAGPATCTGDDAGEPDDGPAAARPLNGAVATPVSLSGSVCNSPGIEADWYRVDVSDGEGVTIGLSWPTTTADLDIAAFDAQGRLVGLAFWLAPESMTLTYLPSGAYYLRLTLAGAAVVPAVAYTITATRTVAQTCATRTDCAATYSNQVYRGTCGATGACSFIAPGTAALGAACDSGDDCMGGECSYSIFESDAALSVCTKTCTTTADCATLGAGYACSTGFTTNVCLPSCTTELQCGADTQSGTLALGQPWDYFTCTAATGACSP